MHHDIGRGTEQLAREVRELAVDMAHTCRQVGLMLTAMKDRDFVAKRVKPSDRVGSGQIRASKDQYAHT
jgi:hypothetical protein